MKILMTSCGGIVRGMEGWYEYGLAKELVRKGHDVTVFSSASVMKAHKAKSSETIDGIEVRRFDPIFPRSFFSMLAGNWDVMHMHHLGYLAPITSYASIRKKLKGIPAVFNVTGLYHDPYLVQDVNDPFSQRIRTEVQRAFPLMPWKIMNWFVHLPIFNADKIIAMTEWEKNEVSKLGIDKNDIVTLPIGIDLAKYKARSKSFFTKRGYRGEMLLFVGQPTRRKGWQYLLAAMPEIIKKFPEAKAVFIGYGKNSEMEQMVRQLGLEKNTIFLGYLSEEEKIQAFQSADAFVFPTLYEGFGMVFLEAMAAGTPIITTDVAGNKELIRNGENGILVRPKDSDSVASAVIRLLNSKALAKKIVGNNLERVKNYQWSTIIDGYTGAYESVMR